MTLLAYSNTSEDINALSTDYPSSSDEEDAIMSPYNKTKLTETPSKIIAEAQRILFTQESRTEDDDDNHNYIKTTIEVNGILVKKVNQERVEKVKKSVRFNMENNRTHEFSVDPSDSLSSLSLDDGTFIANVLDASDLLASDSELSEDDFSDASSPKEGIRLAFSEDIHNPTSTLESNFSTLILSKTENLPSAGYGSDDGESRIDQMVREKSILQQEITDLRAEYEAEVKKLSDEYETRRESYLTDLDDLRLNGYHRLDSSEEVNKEIMMSLEQEQKSIEEREENLKKRRQQCSEQEQEMEEYEKYLNRKQDSMNDKEEDLKILQDELEEFARLLRKKERDLKAKSKRLEDEESSLKPEVKPCPHDDREIAELREKVKTLQGDVLKSRIEIEKKEETSREFESKLQLVQGENKKLQTKVKGLESQLLLDKRIHEAKEECNYVRRTSIMTMAAATQRLNGGLSSSPMNGRPLSSGRLTQLRTPVNGSTVSNDSAFFSNPVKRKITEETTEEHTTTTQRVDSRAVKSRTCVVM